ncbi:MAG: macro domain-containing protein [Planctomycetes bacterium]|nr:macro domain-containing protein [Planctomycetota bacterium]
MIHELNGDLLLSKASVLAHGVAPDDDFKNGLALALRERFPAMYKDFRHWCKTQHPKPGRAWLWRGVDAAGKPVRIVALLTQEAPAHAGGHPGPAHTEYVNHALHELKKLLLAETESVTSIAMPALATGVGGLEWKHVAPLVRTQLAGLPVQVFVYTHYSPGVAAVEPGPKKSQA